MAVYALRDQTGQYRGSPDSPYSTAVTQGAATILVEALRRSGWFLPVEREGLQNLLTERRIVRAIESPTDKGKPAVNLPNLLPASLIVEGGITAYESDVRSGGKGLNILGIGADTQHRVDQVTVGLRSIDIRTGQVLNAVSVTKTIYSFKTNASAYQFIAYRKLLQGETGFATNEPAQLAVREAIESAVIHLTALGVRDRILALKDESDWENPIIQSALKEQQSNTRGDGVPLDDALDEELVAMKPLADEGNDKQVVASRGEAGQPASSTSDAVSAPVLNAPAAGENAGGGAIPPPSGKATSVSPSDDIFNQYWRKKSAGG